MDGVISLGDTVRLVLPPLKDATNVFDGHEGILRRFLPGGYAEIELLTIEHSIAVHVTELVHVLTQAERELISRIVAAPEK